MKIELLSLLLLIVIAGLPTSLTQQPSSSEVQVEGFIAQQNLTAKLLWGTLSIEAPIAAGSRNATFKVDAINVRAPLNLSIEPDGLALELEPCAFGYEIRSFAIGSNLKTLKTLKIQIKEILTVIELLINISSTSLINTVLINGKTTTFIIEKQHENTIVKLPSRLVVDLGRSVEVIIQGDEFSAFINIRRPSEDVINVDSSVSGNASGVFAIVSPAKVLATQEINIPLELLNIENVIEDYKPIVISIYRGAAKPDGGLVEPQPTPPVELPLVKRLLNILIEYKSLILLIGLILLVIGFIIGKRQALIALIALMCFVTYILASWWGG